MPVASVAAGRFRIGFTGQPESKSPVALRLGVPVLDGVAEETIFPPGRPAGRCGEFVLFETEGWLLGAAAVPLSGGIEQTARLLYDDVLRATCSWHLCRIWNYVPHINASADGLENYRAFCRGRSLAFEAGLGADYCQHLSSASAVGTTSDQLAVVFAAATTTPTHFENPAQIPAYRYPAEHGPRAPSFARATATADRSAVFISGTAAIKGHVSIAPGDTAAQLEATLDNLRLISRAAGLGANLGPRSKWTRHFKIYLRHPADLPTIRARLGDVLLRPDDHVTWLHADICRAELNVEIEATLIAN